MLQFCQALFHPFTHLHDVFARFHRQGDANGFLIVQTKGVSQRVVVSIIYSSDVGEFEEVAVDAFDHGIGYVLSMGCYSFNAEVDPLIAGLHGPRVNGGCPAVYCSHHLKGVNAEFAHSRRGEDNFGNRFLFAVNLNARHPFNSQHLPFDKAGHPAHFAVGESFGRHGIKHAVYITEIIINYWRLSAFR